MALARPGTSGNERAKAAAPHESGIPASAFWTPRKTEGAPPSVPRRASSRTSSKKSSVSGRSTSQSSDQAPKLWARLLEKVSVVLDEERKNEDTGEASVRSDEASSSSLRSDALSGAPGSAQAPQLVPLAAYAPQTVLPQTVHLWKAPAALSAKTTPTAGQRNAAQSPPSDATPRADATPPDVARSTLTPVGSHSWTPSRQTWSPRVLPASPFLPARPCGGSSWASPSAPSRQTWSPRVLPPSEWNIAHTTLQHALSPTCEVHSQNLKGTAFEKFIGKGQAKNLFFKVPSGGGPLKNRLFLVCALVETAVSGPLVSVQPLASLVPIQREATATASASNTALAVASPRYGLRQNVSITSQQAQKEAPLTARRPSSVSARSGRLCSHGPYRSTRSNGSDALHAHDAARAQRTGRLCSSNRACCSRRGARRQVVTGVFSDPVSSHRVANGAARKPVGAGRHGHPVSNAGTDSARRCFATLHRVRQSTGWEKFAMSFHSWPTR
eukprot:g15739.t3